MPYKSETMIIAHTEFDKRIKLTAEDKEVIKELHENGMSQRKLAKKFNVSRKLISFIIDPSKLEECKKRREERGGWKQYYDKEKHAKYIKKHRTYKQELYLENKIKEG